MERNVDDPTTMQSFLEQTFATVDMKLSIPIAVILLGAVLYSMNFGRKE